MKNNAILGLQGFKKVLKSISFLALSLAVFSADARNQPKGNPRAVPRNIKVRALGNRTPAQRPLAGGGPVAPVVPANKRVQQVEFLMKQNNIQRNQLSPEGQIIVREVEAGNDWESFWDRYIDTTQNASEKSFLKELRSELVKKKKKIEDISAQDKELKEQKMINRRLLKAIEGLQEKLAMQNKGILDYMYESIAAASPALAISGGSGAVATLAGLTTMSGGALVGLSALGLVSGLNYVSEKIRTGELSDAIAKAMGANVITQYMNDSGKYPTFASRIDGITNDILNTSALDDNTFENYRKTVLGETRKKKEEAFANAAVKEAEEKLDAQIRLIQAKYFDEDPEVYMKKLESIKNIENIIQAQAIISEYLRAAFREGQIKLLENKKAEEAKKAAEKPKTTGFWSYLGY